MNNRVKQFILFSVVVLSCVMANAQSPVRWEFSSKKINTGTFEITAVATIQPEWHIYSQQTNEDLGMPTTFSFSKNPLIEFISDQIERGDLRVEDKGASRFYEGQVEFVHVVKLKGTKAKTNLIGKVDFMACTHQNCLPPDEVNFSLILQ